MDAREEIRQIRQELMGLERSVARLHSRLEEVEKNNLHVALPETEKGEKKPGETDFHAAGRGAVDQAPFSQQENRPSSSPPPLPPTFTAKAPAPPAAKSAKDTQAVINRIEASLNRPPVDVVPPRKHRKFGPPEDMSFEMALGSYWLPRIGMLLVAIATAWGFTFVSQQFKDAAWMPYARVATGYGLSAILLGIGWWLEKKYTNYARLLMGGGLGIIYFVTFATWYIPQTRIAPSQEFTLMLLGLLVAGWGGLAHWRRSQLLAFSMTALGHFTVALSTLSLDTPSNAAVGGLILLGLGSAWFMQRNGWHLVAMAAMIGSYLNQFFWLSRSPGSDLPKDFAVGMAVLVAYLVIYAVAERLTPASRITVKPRERNLFVAINTAGFVLLGLALMRSFSFVAPFDYQLYFGTAAFTGIMGLSYLQRKPKDTLASIYFVKTSVLIAVGLATWLDGSTLTFSLALEALVLLLMARHNKTHTGRILALGAAVLTALHGGTTFLGGELTGFGAPGVIGEALVAVAVVLVFGVLGEVYRVTPWDQFPGVTYLPSLRGLWVWLEMSPSKDTQGSSASRMTLSHGLVGLGALMLLGYVQALSRETDIPNIVIWLALAVMSGGLWRRSAPLLSGAVFLSAMGTLWWFHQLIDMPQRLGGSLVPVLACMAPLLIGSELLRIAVPARLKSFALLDDIQGAWYRNALAIATGYGVVAAAVIVFSVGGEINAEDVLLLCGGLGLLGTIYASQTKGANIGLFALSVMVLMPLSVMMLRGDYETWRPILGIAMLGCAATGVESRWWGSRVGLEFHRLVPVPYVLYGIFAWCAGSLALREMALEYDVLALLILAGALAGMMPWLHARAMAIHCTILCTLACMIWLSETAPQGDEDWWKMSAIYLVAMTLGSDRWIARYPVFDKPVIGWILQGLAWGTMCQSNRVLASGLWGSGGLALIGIVFLAYGIVFRQRIALLLSFASGVLATSTLVLASTLDVTVDVICLNYGLVIAYWVATERVTNLVLSRTGAELDEGQRPKLAAVLTGTIAILGLICLARIEPIHDFYLTISWTVWALALFAWALATGQSWFRYVALGTIGVALGRAFLIDVWQLKGLYRVGAMLFLGLTLLGVAYGYTKWRGAQGETDDEGGA